MTVRQSAATRPIDPAHERIQRDHELNAALEAARALQARLELLGDRAADVELIHSLRDSLARDVVVNGRPPKFSPEENGVTLQRFFKEKGDSDDTSRKVPIDAEPGRER